MARLTEKGLIARKIGMTRFMTEEGKAVAVTLLKVEKQKITKILTPEKNGYRAYQVGYFEKAEKNLNKPDILRLRKVDISESFARFNEFRTSTSEAVSALGLGAQLSASLFEGVSRVDVTGITKGRGFQGAIKRWNSARGKMTHGSMYHRRTGSIGSNTSPGRVFKNKHMPGHMGTDRKTIKNLEVLSVDVQNDVIAIRGAVPGCRDGYLEIRPAR